MSLKETFSETDGMQGHYLLAGFDDDGDGGWCRWLDTSQYRFGRSISMWMGTLCASVLSAIHPLCAHVYARIERKATREATVAVGKKKFISRPFRTSNRLSSMPCILVFEWRNSSAAATTSTTTNQKPATDQRALSSVQTEQEQTKIA